MKRQLDLSQIRECGMPEKLLSGIFRSPIGHIDVYAVERWNGLKTIATSFRIDIDFEGHIFHRRVQLFHPFGIYPFPQYKIDSIKQREKEGWKGFLLAANCTDNEIKTICDNFLEYPVQGSDTALVYYRRLEELNKEIEDVRKIMQEFVGRVCLVQVVDTNAKDHSGARRNFPLNQFLSDDAARSVWNAYKTNLKDDFTLSQVGAGVVELGYGATR